MDSDDKYGSDDEDYFKKKPTTTKSGQAAPSYLLHGKLTLKIWEAQLPIGHHKINPFVQLKCGGESFKTDSDNKGDKNPKWNHSIIINFANAQKDDVMLHLVVTDKGTFSKNIAKLDVPADLLFPQKTDGKALKEPHEFSLVNLKNPKQKAKIWLSAVWDGRGMPWQDDEALGSNDTKETKKAIMMHGKLTLTVHRAENLRDVQTFGKQDPYVEIKFAEYLYKTRVHEKAGSFPIWNQDFLLNVDHPQSEQISFLVYDKEPLLDNKIARIDLSIGKLLLKKGREQLLGLVFWDNFTKIGGDLYVTAKYEGTGAPITEEDKKKEKELKDKEAKEAKELEDLVLSAVKKKEDEANEILAKLHTAHEKAKLEAEQEIKRQQEELQKKEEELKKAQEELRAQHEETNRLKRQEEEKARLLAEQQAEQNALEKKNKRMN